MFEPSAFKRAVFFLIFDLLLSLFTLVIAYNLRFNFEVPVVFSENILSVFVIIAFLKIFSLYYFRIYNIAWRFFSLGEVKKIFYAHLIAYTLFTLIFYIFPNAFDPFPRSVLIIDLFLSMLFIGFFRISKRLITEGKSDSNLKKTLLVGVSPFAQTLFKEQNDFYICAVVDNSDMIVGTYFSSIRVKSFDDIGSIIKDDSIESIVITKEFSQEVLQELYVQFDKYNIYDIKIAILSQKNAVLKDLSIEDLLARHPKDLDKEKIASFVEGKTILVTGAGGSIGSEICRQCKLFGVKKLILLDNSEYNLYTITEELSGVELVSVMQSVVNLEDIKKTFAKHQPDIVIHAAAYKHVPLVEDNIEEGIVNNIIGTKNLIDTAINNGVKKVVLISTDKAVRPTNVMGTTKRICELYAQNVVSNSTEIVAVRFGNVLGSSGSVIPKFKAQIEAGKNITVTHPDITRYFMLIPEACELVLQAGAIGEGGEIFILDMGEPVKIVDLAQKMIDLSDRDDINIEFTGLRPGEKLYEELLIDESDAKTDYESITVARPTPYDIEKLNQDIDELLRTEDKILKLKEIVPEFNHQLN